LRFGLLQLARAHTGATPDVAMVLYDLRSTDKLQRVTVWASFFAIIVQQLRTPVGLTAPGHAFATWVQSPQLRARVTGVKLDWRGFDAVQRTIRPRYIRMTAGQA
jgi:hypothetical protein